MQFMFYYVVACFVSDIFTLCACVYMYLTHLFPFVFTGNLQINISKWKESRYVTCNVFH